MSPRILYAVAALVGFAVAAPANATLTITNACDVTTPDPDATACAGFYSGNLLNQARFSDQQTAVDSLPSSFTLTGSWSDFAPSVVSSLSNGMLSFGQTLFGDTIIGVHFGDAGTGLGDRTVFYEFDFGTTGNNGITLNTNGFSNAVLYTTGISAVPEPATWAMMILGFGVVGMAIRRRRKTSRSTQLA